MKQPDAVADVSLLTTQQGGRRVATHPNWFGCPIALPGVMLDCRMRLHQPLHPGNSRRVELFFLDPDLAAVHLRPGTVFDLWEGHVIGSGVIHSIAHLTPSQPPLAPAAST